MNKGIFQMHSIANPACRKAELVFNDLDLEYFPKHGFFSVKILSLNKHLIQLVDLPPSYS